MYGSFEDNVDSALARASRSPSGAPKPNIGLSDVFNAPNGLVKDAAFQALTMDIGKDTLKKWIDSLHYGNQDIGGPLDSCWFDGHLRIPADQELGLIKKLYFNQLPFFRRPQEIVRGLMKKESNTNYTLVYKTADATDNGQTPGWVLGWVEENKHPYFFVLNFDVTNSKADVGQVGVQLVKRILPTMGFFEGKK
jgi:beta-lactamase class D